MPTAPASPMIGVTSGNLPVIFGLHPIQHIPVRFMGAVAADLVDQALFICPVGQSFQLVAIDEIHATAGTNGSAVTLQVTKDTGTTAPGAGTDLLTNNTSAGFDLKGTANTVQNGTLTATTADLVFVAGDRLSIDFAGTLTALVGVLVTGILKRIS